MSMRQADIITIALRGDDGRAISSIIGRQLRERIY